MQKKRKYGRDQPDENEKQPDDSGMLKDATTLYVGNLFVSQLRHVCAELMWADRSTPPKSKYTSYSQSAVRSRGLSWA